MDTLITADLVLEPLTRDHAEAMFEVLRDPELYRYLDYPPPPSAEHLRRVYAELERRTSPDGTELWLNWVISPRDLGLVGFVQATVSGAEAWLAYVLSREHQGRGYASRAVRAVMGHLRRTCGITRFLAKVEAENEPSIRLLQRVGFRPAGTGEAEAVDLSATERLFVAGPGSGGL